MKNPTKQFIPVLIICLSASLLAGFAADTPAANPAGKPKAVPAQSGVSTQETLKRMTQELKLTEDQQKKVKDVIDAQEQKMRTVLGDSKLTPQEVGAKGRESRQVVDKQLREILTPQQYQQWQKSLAQRTIRRRPEAPSGTAPAPKASPPQSGGGPAEKQ